MAVKPFSKEELNFLKFASIVHDEFPKMLRSTFVALWNSKIAPLTGYQVWDDTPAVRTLLKTLEGGKTVIPTSKSIEDWDCTALFKATIYSKTFAISTTMTIKTLSDRFIKGKKPSPFHASLVSPTGTQDETITLAIDQIRLLRNELCHSPKPVITKPTFDSYVKLALDAFTAVGFPTNKIFYIGSLQEVDFPTQRVNELNRKNRDVELENFKFLKENVEEGITTLTDNNKTLLDNNKTLLDNNKRFEANVMQELHKINKNVDFIKNQASKTECSANYGIRGLSAVGALFPNLSSSDGGTITIKITTEKIHGLKALGVDNITLGEFFLACEEIVLTCTKKGFGGERDDQKFGEIKQGCLLVSVHCLTDERFLEVLDDFETGRLKKRLLEEFSLIGVEIEGFEIGIKNIKEVNKRKEVIKRKLQETTHLKKIQNLEATDEEESPEMSSRRITITVSVPNEHMGRIIGPRGENIKKIQSDTRTRITKYKPNERESGFYINGMPSDCEKAKLAITRCFLKFFSWKKKQILNPYMCKNMAITDCLENKEDRNYQKVVEVQKKYITIVVGKDHKNIDDIATKSETKIIVRSRRTSEDAGGDTIPIKIIGPQANCDRAEALIQQCVVIIKDRQKRNEYGGDTKFVCFDFKEKTEEFRLISDVSPPKLDGFLKGMRYRIQTAMEKDNDENDFNHDRTVLEIRERLLTPLQNIRQCKDEKGLLIDLWCHFGKVFVSNVDEGETIETLTAEAINGRLLKIINEDELKGKNRDAFWRVSFEEGVDPSRINEDAFEEDEYLDFKLDHTQWRYDFGFTTPTGRNVRFKVWEGLPSDTEDEPPMEVKNILTQVVLRGNESIKAWLCYPSTSVLRGEIMIPASPYDCRIKLRGGPRYVTDKDEVCLEEDAILSDYLSHCTIDTAEHKMSIPDDKDHEMPEGFAWTFYRRAEEKMYRTSLDDEGFLVIVLDESGGDSDASSWREKKQLGFRVVMDAWTDALLSTERNWKPEEIVDKLGIYMRFLGLLQSVLFLDAIVDPS